MSAADELYAWVTQYGQTSAERALGELSDRRKIERDLNHAWGPYGCDFMHNKNMPTFEEALAVLYGEVKARLQQEA